MHTYTYSPGSSAGKESTCNRGDPVSIPGSGRSPREGICYPLWKSWASLVAQMVKNLPIVQEIWVGKIPWRRAWQFTPVFLPGESQGCLENPMDRGAWQDIVHTVAKSWIRQVMTNLDAIFKSRDITLPTKSI